MAAQYGDGLDDFDRDLLGHGPQPFQPSERTAHHPPPVEYFPRSNVPHRFTPSNGYDTYHDETPVLNTRPEPEAPRRTVAYEDVWPTPATISVIRPESAHLSTEFHNASQLASTSLNSAYERSSRSARSSATSPQLPGSSSPTARLSARKQRNAPNQTAVSSLQPSLSTKIALTSHDNSHSTPLVHGIPLISLRQALPDKFRAIFPYELLNAVQSKCFNVVYGSNDNVVVAAPTGSGKTAILELAICKLALDRGNENFKIVYQAPTKALCSEKARDWEKKFSHMNLKCAELTGDTSHTEMRRVGDASIIVTTPEKWDSITRKWQDHRRLLQLVELFLIDEVHILKDIRGATLEAVVSRMKTIGANVRFIALSATVPNSDDIARWLGRNHTTQQLPAHREAFGEEFRPVKLQKFVYGFDSRGNDFIFDKYLDQKLPGLLSKHARQKPILIFCFTRKSCENTAAMLADFASGRPDGEKLWPVPSQRVPVLSRELQEIVKFGVAFHHAGLDVQDRAAVEQHFLKGQLGVICCTSTLAVGINLPCHTVVLKGTVGFTDEKLEEYSDLEVMQMLGRAGRPQFDDSATAIILTRTANKQRYEKMVSGQEILESTLHLHLIEHLNSEICLGTINDIASAKTWLAGTFLSVRLRRNPGYYQLTAGATNPSQIDARLEEICERDIKQLQNAELVTNHNAFACTEYGRAMSKYMVEFNTMNLLLQIPRAAGMETLITMLSQATEFKEFRFKPAERPLFREINQSPLIMYPIREVVNQTGHKVSLMIQAHLGCVQYPDTGEAAKARRQLMMERKRVFERLNRLIRAVIDCKGHDRDATGTRTALELARSLAAGSWEGRATQLTQVPNIGPVGMRKLASKNIRTVLELADRDYGEIERLMSRQPPFGKKLQADLERFPRLDMKLAVAGRKILPRSEEPVVLEVKATLRYLNQKGPPNWLNRLPALTFLVESGAGALVFFWRGSMRKLDNQSGFELAFSVGLRAPHDRIVCHFTCEEIVGTIVSKSLDHNVPASVFPSRPPPATAGFIQSNKSGNHEYLDDEGINDADLILAAEQALSHPSVQQGVRAAAETENKEYTPVKELLNVAGAEEGAGSQNFDNELANGDDDENEMDANAMHGSRQPIRLPSGKWQCNHSCSGDAPTRSGKLCSHKCCRDGLDKPRKRSLQKPKRKREESAGAEAIAAKGPSTSQTGLRQSSKGMVNLTPGTMEKRQKVHAMPTLTRPMFAPPSGGSTQTPKVDWKDAGFDAMGLECIDLSWIDDEEDGFEMYSGDVSRNLSQAKHDMPKASQGGPSKMPGNNRLKEDKLVSTRASLSAQPLSNQAKTSTATTSIGPPDDYFDDDLSLFDDRLSPASLTTPTSAAFRSGASDAVLYQGISKKFAESRDTSSLQGSTCVDTPETAKTRLGAGRSRPDNTSPPHLVDDNCSEIHPNNSQDSPAIPNSASTENVQDKGLKKGNEPAWVAEFDPEFVDMFRGYVTFV